MTEVRSDFKEGRKVADRDEWTRIVTEKHGPCRSCGSTERIEFHHLVSRSLRGDDVEPNIVPLCSGCHAALENHTTGWEYTAHAVRASLTPLELAYVKAKKGPRWLDRYLPTGGVLCPRCRKATAETGTPREPARRRKNFIVKVPDDAENGAAILTELVAANRDRIKTELGWSDDVPAYFVLAAVLSESLQAERRAA